MLILHSFLKILFIIFIISFLTGKIYQWAIWALSLSWGEVFNYNLNF